MNPESAAPLLEVRRLVKRYRRRTGWRVREREVLRGVDLRLERGRTLAVVGDSAAGKSTLARCIARLERPDTGTIMFEGRDVAQLDARELRPLRREIQLIFQDASTALNPRFTAEELIAEPLVIQKQGTEATRRERVRGLMGDMGLSPDWAGRRAGEFSGGQQQRLAIARALALGPKLLLLDEALSGLDLSTEAQIANLLLELQTRYALSYILISHDISLVAQFADEVAVMRDGAIVEQGAASRVLGAPQHAATQSLVAAAQATARAMAAGTRA